MAISNATEQIRNLAGAIREFRGELAQARQEAVLLSDAVASVPLPPVFPEAPGPSFQFEPRPKGGGTVGSGGGGAGGLLPPGATPGPPGKVSGHASGGGGGGIAPPGSRFYQPNYAYTFAPGGGGASGPGNIYEPSQARAVADPIVNAIGKLERTIKESTDTTNLAIRTGALR